MTRSRTAPHHHLTLSPKTHRTTTIPFPQHRTAPHRTAPPPNPKPQNRATTRSYYRLAHRSPVQSVSPWRTISIAGSDVLRTWSSLLPRRLAPTLCFPSGLSARSPHLRSSVYREMFLKVRMSWNVVIAAENLDAQGLLLQRAILVRLLEDFATKKATKDLGYLLAVTTVDNIGEGKVRPHSGDVLFPVDFTCLTFRFFRGEIAEGVVTKILKHGVFLSCGPVESVFLSSKKMPGYELVPGDENQMFVSEKRAKLEKNTLVRFSVMDSKFVESERVFMALGSLDGDHLGAI